MQVDGERTILWTEQVIDIASESLLSVKVCVAFWIQRLENVLVGKYSTLNPWRNFVQTVRRTMCKTEYSTIHHPTYEYTT